MRLEPGLAARKGSAAVFPLPLGEWLGEGQEIEDCRDSRICSAISEPGGGSVRSEFVSAFPSLL